MTAFDAPQLLQMLLGFTLVLARIGGLLAVAPVFSTPHLAYRLRAIFAVLLALIVTPLAGSGGRLPNFVDFVVLLVSETLIGLALGLGVALLFGALRVAGQLVSQMGGMRLADVFSAGSDESVPVVSEFLYMVALAVFLTSGGHRRVIEALLDTFQALPPGSALSAESAVGVMTTLAIQCFSLGIRAAAPIVASLLLATLVTGLVSRTLPQLTSAVAGFGAQAVIMLATLGVSLGAALCLFDAQVEPVLETLVDAIRG